MHQSVVQAVANKGGGGVFLARGRIIGLTAKASALSGKQTRHLFLELDRSASKERRRTSHHLCRRSWMIGEGKGVSGCV